MGVVRSYTNRILIVLATLAIILITPSIIMRETIAPYLFADSANIPVSNVVVVPGASVVRGAPSPVLSARAEAAIGLWKKGQVSWILVTGDNGGRSYDEVTPVFNYLVDAGIPAKSILLDRAGFDTYSSMYRAHNLVGPLSVVIVTQDFHLPRAVFIARMLGIDARGLSASSGGTFFDYLRELPASWKAIFDLARQRTPEI